MQELDPLQSRITYARQDAEPGGDIRLAAGLVMVGLGFSIAFGLSSPRGIIHFDDLTHFLYAKWAWQWPAYLLDEWGRPGFTALYFLPAGLGWPACRVTSALLTAGGAWLGFRIAQRMRLRHAWAVVVLCYAQPLFFQLSQTTLTETALAFYVALAVYLAQRGRWSWSAAVMSIGLVTRHEAIIFLPIWVFFALWHRRPGGEVLWRRRPGGEDTGGTPVPQRSGIRPWRLWPFLWAPLLVNVLAWLADLRPPVLRLLAATPSTQYGCGGWLTFFSRSMEAWGPGVMVLAMTGMVALWRKPRGGALVGACVVVYFALQTAVRALGLFDSGGYARFLVAVSPLAAVAALVGWQQLCTADAQRRKGAVLIAAASMVVLWVAMERQLVLHAAGLDEAAYLPGLYKAKIAVRTATPGLVVLAIASLAWARRVGTARFARALVPGGLTAIVLLASYGLCHPLREPVEAGIIEDLLQHLEARGLGDREIISANVWLNDATGRKLPPGRPAIREQLEAAPVGTLFVWEKQFAGSPDHGLRLEEFESNEEAFHLVCRTGPVPFGREPYLTIFEKTGPWGRAAAERAGGDRH